MYLKRINLVGFKSFADRISLNFDQNHITGIVGPNGSGKSNIIDAVRWVMGEQNAKMLRGEKATDIIFSGSEKRKALGMAEVTLVFDNQSLDSNCPEEYRYEEEISLTRRLYLDGQREFLINKRSCRLKDIVSFFIASGIGGRSYSMIQQGQVDRILQAKPEQLREIVEEAAGIVVFKKKHDETQRKLEQTQQNIHRLEDISKEVESRLEALEEQATKARKWQEYTQKLTAKEYEYVTQSFLLHIGKKHKLTGEKEKDDLARIKISSDSNRFQEELEQFKKQLAETDPELSSITEEITKIREKLASSETKLISTMTSLEGGERRCSNLKNQISEDNKNLESFNERHEKLEQDYKKAKDITENADHIFEEYQTRIEAYLEQELVFDSQLEEVVQEFVLVEKKFDAAMLRLDSIKGQTHDYRQDKQVYTQKLMTLENEHSQILILVDSSHIKVKNKENELSGRELQKEQLEAKAKKNSEQQEKINSGLETSKYKYIEYSTRLNYYKELKHWTQDVQTWLSELSVDKSKKSIILSNEIGFNDSSDDLSTDVCKAFEKWSERVVINHIDLLEPLENKVKDEGLGPVPVSFCHEKYELSESDQKWITENKLEQITNFIQDKSEGDLVTSLLSRVYWAPVEFFSKEDLSYRPKDIIILTKNGGVYSNSYDFNIGFGSEDSALFIEEQKLDLSTKSKKYLERMNEEKAKQKTLKEEEKKLALELNLMIDEIHMVRQDQLSLLGELQNLKQQANNKQEMIHNVRLELKEFVEKNQAVEKERIDLESSTSRLSQDKKEFQKQEADLKELKEGLQEKTQEVKTQLEEFRYDKITAETKLQTFEISYEQNRLQLSTFKDRLKRLVSELAEVEKEKVENKDQKSELEDSLSLLNSQKEKLETLLSNKKSENSALTNAIRKSENEIRKCKSEIDKISNYIQERTISLEKLELLIQSVKEQAREKCSIEDIETLDLTRDENFHIQNCNKQMSNLKSKIEAIGPINMMAVEEYDELAKRRDFISAQKEEVNAAINLLELAIEEITQTSERKFLSAFDALNREFKELFPVLFPRGKGELILTDEEKPLASGVEIMVRLPGKSLQSMRLFSGGEKALTAIALIFALLKSKPTPFCFLDEVDAALDEANVGHYNRLLESLSDRFQFIVITHRRGTMEVLDTLYGVTMQEPGVSKVVGVDLSKSLPAHLQKAFKEKEANKVAPGKVKKVEYML